MKVLLSVLVVLVLALASMVVGAAEPLSEKVATTTYAASSATGFVATMTFNNQIANSTIFFKYATSS